MARVREKGHAALRRGRVAQPHHAYLLTAGTVERRAWFREFPIACAAVRGFSAPGVVGDATLLAWVLMPDHAHWLVQLGERDALSTVARRLKSSSANAANKAMNRRGSLWARGFHDRALRKEEDLRIAARYVIGNPVRAGIVREVGAYPFWNAVWL